MIEITLGCRACFQKSVKFLKLPDEMDKVAEKLKKWTCNHCGANFTRLYIDKIEKS